MSKVSTDRLKVLLYKFLDDSKDSEFEIRFGTKGIKKISKNNFDNVVSYLLAKNFKLSEENQILKIRNEYIDPKTGSSRISNIRTEVTSAFSIQKVCKHKTNSIIEDDTLIPGVVFTQKTYKRQTDGSVLRPEDFDDFNFRATYQTDKSLTRRNGLVVGLINDWDNKKKLFRLMNRFSYISSDYPGIRVDMSIVRESKKNDRGNMVPVYNIRESEVFTSPYRYEIEIEVLPDALDKKKILTDLRKTIKFVLSGLQETNYPVSYNEIREVGTDYIKMIFGDEHPKYVSSKHFIGPSSISLELKNIQPINEDNLIGNIRKPYTVTEKADGMRKLLFINKTGKIYLIDTNMNVQFTGMKTSSKTHHNSILDGEHILYDKHGLFLNMYAAFDIYYINDEDQRTKKFVNHTTDDTPGEEFRLNKLDTFVRTLNAQHIIKDGNQMVINRKVFEVSPNEHSIFNACKQIHNRIEDGMYQYETDGLIFTPCDLGVGMTYGDKEAYNYKHTWLHSFKWKPPEFNTIDFLVTTVKNESGQDIVNNIFEEGEDMSLQTQFKHYKTLVLRVGFDEKKHGYINPCEDVIQDRVSRKGNMDETTGYRPMPFYPTNPYINKAYLCNIMLKHNGIGNYMFTEDGSETIEDETIVEFKYIKDKETGWNWVPIRVRYDKTAEYRSGLKNYGNAYHVAQSVWSSIHHPITEHMITTGQDIPEFQEDDDVYYNTYGKSLTKPLRDFHNKYVKQVLIKGASRRGGTLIDLAVGKGGDLPKWISAKLKFVLGIDVSKDNIENRLNGACARYLNQSKTTRNMVKALFVNGNSKLNIKDGTGVFSEKGKEIINAINGKGPKDKGKLGEGVYKQYGIGKDGFDVVSCQFALHYFFENPEILHNFLQNVSENCKVGGYFIGTSYDGKHIFKTLRDTEEGESVSEYTDEKKIWEIRKSYNQEEFNADSSSLGLAIDVYQETINKMFREYLVHYDYLTEVLKNYGFELASKDEANRMGLPNSIGMFSDLYNAMKNDIKKQKRKSSGKTTTELEVGEATKLDDLPQQRRISFLNKYFIFKKINNVNAEQVKNTALGSVYQGEIALEKTATEDAMKVAEEVEKVKEAKQTIKKTKKKLRLKIKQ
mgnify:CR=1 FL=1